MLSKEFEIDYTSTIVQFFQALFQNKFNDVSLSNPIIN